MKEIVQYVYDTRVRGITTEIYGVGPDGTAGLWAKLDRGRPIGCLVALGPDKIGWSRVYGSDVFSKKRAKQIARGRAKEGLTPVPYKFIPAYKKIVERSRRVHWDEEGIEKKPDTPSSL